MLSSEPQESTDLFEKELRAIEEFFDLHFNKTGSNLAENVRTLRRLKAMNKFELETFLINH